jgi:hypothetical protein
MQKWTLNTHLWPAPLYTFLCSFTVFTVFNYCTSLLFQRQTFEGAHHNDVVGGPEGNLVYLRRKASRNSGAESSVPLWLGKNGRITTLIKAKTQTFDTLVRRLQASKGHVVENNVKTPKFRQHMIPKCRRQLTSSFLSARPHSSSIFVEILNPNLTIIQA